MKRINNDLLLLCAFFPLFIDFETVGTSSYLCIAIGRGKYKNMK